ncbi:MAG: hypothetical protein JSR66_20055 [Proteobacteria bacterium]|nr:hypothetical protein [Pseudomonadota bacterium]
MSANSESAPLTRAQELAELHGRFRLPLLAYFARRVRSASEAQDLVQDVFERVARSIGTQVIRNPDALVFRIAVNLLRDRARRARRRGVEVPLPTEETTEFADAFIVDLSPERVVLGELSLPRYSRRSKIWMNGLARCFTCAGWRISRCGRSAISTASRRAQLRSR